MEHESKTSFLLSGIRPKVSNYNLLNDENDMMWLAPIKIDNFTKNDGANYLLHINKKELNLCKGKNLQVALSCSGLNKEKYTNKILDKNALNHENCKVAVLNAKIDAEDKCEKSKIDQEAILDFVSKTVNDGVDFLKAKKIEKNKKIIMKFKSDIEIEDPKINYNILDPGESYKDCTLDQDKKGFTCEIIPTFDIIPDKNNTLETFAKFEIKANVESNGKEIIFNEQGLQGWATYLETNKNEGFGNMLTLQGICVDEKKQIYLFLFLILVSFVVLNIDDILKKVRKFMKKLVC